MSPVEVCARCESAPATGRYRSKHRRTSGRGWLWSLPYGFCAPCAELIADLLRPGATLEREPEAVAA